MGTKARSATNFKIQAVVISLKMKFKFEKRVLKLKIFFTFKRSLELKCLKFP